MVEAASPKNYAFTDKESTEAWLTQHGIEFQVSFYRANLGRPPHTSPSLIWRT